MVWCIPANMCGLDRCSTFNKVIDGLTLHLQSGDCCIFLRTFITKIKIIIYLFQCILIDIMIRLDFDCIWIRSHILVIKYCAVIIFNRAAMFFLSWQFYPFCWPDPPFFSNSVKALSCGNCIILFLCQVIIGVYAVFK